MGNELEGNELKKKLLLIGGGGHCHSVLDSVLALCEYDEIGIIDSINSSCLGIPVVGADADIPSLKEEGWTDAFITVGSVGNTAIRRRLYEMVRNLGLSIPTIIDPTAVVARGTDVKEGSYIGKQAIINTNSSIGTCAIVNTGAIIEHDCVVGEFSHISPGTILCGQVTARNDSHIGAGTVVRQQIIIGARTLIGAGSVVIKDIPDGVKAYGNPCKVIE